MELTGISAGHPGMSRADRLMRQYFGASVELVKYWGPEQMCVFYLEYKYIPLDYKIIIECERGFIIISVTNQIGEKFSPWMIYPEADYSHYEDKAEDVLQLVRLTYQAIDKKEISFCSDDKLKTLRRDLR
jgi:hypothetical protein